MIQNMASSSAQCAIILCVLLVCTQTHVSGYCACSTSSQVVFSNCSSPTTTCGEHTSEFCLDVDANLTQCNTTDTDTCDPSGCASSQTITCLGALIFPDESECVTRGILRSENTSFAQICSQNDPCGTITTSNTSATSTATTSIASPTTAPSPALAPTLCDVRIITNEACMSGCVCSHLWSYLGNRTLIVLVVYHSAATH